MPDYSPACNNLAWILATSPLDAVRNGARAVDFARQANQIARGQDPNVLSTLAAAYAEAGRFTDAITAAQEALRLATARNDTALINDLRLQLGCYQRGSPFRVPMQMTAPDNPRR
jgi:Flp pilus assembly protein TadD